MHLTLLRIAAVPMLLALGFSAHAAPPGAQLEVDAREISRGVQHAHLVLPVKPGNLTLLYPKWLPGEHAPTGPVGGLSGLKFVSGGQTLIWHRDNIDLYAFRVLIPPAATSLDVEFEIDAVSDAKTPPNAERLATNAMAIVHWNELILYPAGTASDDMQISASLKLPAGWSFGSALPQASSTGADVSFKPASLTTLIDSPVLAGSHFKTVELGGNPNVVMHMAADSEAELAMKPETLTHYRKLVSEAESLFGAAHYREYHFLWMLSDHIGSQGIEHHESSDNRSAAHTLIDDEVRHSWDALALLPHEYVHSWNGKYRRPAGVATGNYDAPMRGDLLWVYEGLTEYLGYVLSARSGLSSVEDAHGLWADVAASMQSDQGRTWRPLADTAIAASIGYDSTHEWRNRTRGVDFYDESALLWLEADVLIRTRTQGTKSLDDFCRAFYGPPGGVPKVVPYEFDDVVKGLNGILPYDWRGFWRERLERLGSRAPLEGLTASGWHLNYVSEPTPTQRGDDAVKKSANFSYSLGFTVADEGGAITTLVPGSPADQAGISPGAHLIAVNGRKYSKTVLLEALEERAPEPHILKLLTERDDMFDTTEVRYSGKAAYPTLERDGVTPDLLSAILSPAEAENQRSEPKHSHRAHRSN